MLCGADALQTRVKEHCAEALPSEHAAVHTSQTQEKRLPKDGDLETHLQLLDGEEERHALAARQLHGGGLVVQAILLLQFNAAAVADVQLA